jgi:HK97 family phage prohead protease
MQTKSLPITIEKSASPDFDARFVMSAATPDRMGDTIATSAYKSAAASIDKLIALWQHDADKPIGFFSNLKAQGDRLIGDLKLANTNLAQMIKQLIADGVPLSASIGFRGDADIRRNDKGDPIGLHFKAIELLETSIVSVPAHPRAVQIAKSFGLASVIEAGPETADSGDSLPTETIKRAKAAILAANRTVRKKP